MVGMQAPDGLDDVGLRSPVDFGDVVVAPLAMDFDGLEARHGAHDDVAGAARGANRDIE